MAEGDRRKPTVYEQWEDALASALTTRVLLSGPMKMRPEVIGQGGPMESSSGNIMWGTNSTGR